MLLRQLFEQKRLAVIAFGRMNPPTIGHQKLVEKIKSINGDHYLFLSQSQKPKTDPLDFTEKLRYVKFFFPELTIGHPNVKTPVQALQMIQELGYTDVVFVAGSDRVDSFQTMFDTYNGKPDKSGNIPFQFDTLKVVSAGERDPDADGAEGMSASKMRAAAADNDLESFKQGVPKPELADEMFAAVRQGMGIRDEEPVAAEDASEDEEDLFHRKLDKLVHRTFGHSSDEKKKKKAYEGKYMKIFELLKENVDNALPPTIKPLQVPQFPEMPQQDGELGQGQQAGPTKDGGKYLSGSQGKFIWDAQGNPSKWQAPTFSGMSQTVDMKTGDITVRYQNGPLDVSGVYDKTGKKKEGQGSAGYDMGVATVRSGPNGASVTDRGTGRTTQVNPNDPNSVRNAIQVPQS